MCTRVHGPATARCRDRTSTLLESSGGLKAPHRISNTPTLTWIPQPGQVANWLSVHLEWIHTKVHGHRAGLVTQVDCQLAVALETRTLVGSATRAMGYRS